MSREGKHKATEGEQFARPLWDAVRDLETEYDCLVRTELVMSGRKGVIELRLAAYRSRAGRAEGAVCAVADDWPSAQATGLPAMMYRLAFKLGHLLEEHRLQEAQADAEFRRWRP